jgi:hypothetical protein
MTDRPILFSDLMIRALIEGRKTQTRRVLNRLTRFGPITEFGYSDTNDYDWHFRDKEMRWHDLRHSELEKVLPYAPGDRLWVRETWRPRGGYSNWDLLISYPADGEEIHLGDGDADIDDWNFPKAAKTGNVSPALMPRWASRLTLTVTDVRVQRLQDISNTEARAEGAVDEEWDQWREDVMNVAPGGSKIESERDSFSYIWDSLNEKRGYGWDANPWVVALTFDVQQQNIDHMRDAA